MDEFPLVAVEVPELAAANDHPGNPLRSTADRGNHCVGAGGLRRAGRVAFLLGAEPQLQAGEASYDLMARLTNSPEPQSIHDCKGGEFPDFGFRDQDLCVASVASADSDG